MKVKASKKCRLDHVLGTLADNGVKIYILLFKEVQMALPLNSIFSKRALLKRNNHNIKVVRHPQSLISLWSHHEKLLIVDQRVSLIGGLDLCYGRMDNKYHLLTDYHQPPSARISHTKADNIYFWPGQDYSNPRIKDFRNVHLHKQCTIDRKFVPRMPWHDVAMKIQGHTVRDLVKHFIEVDIYNIYIYIYSTGIMLE